MTIDPMIKVQIKVQVKILLFDRTLISVPIKYSNYIKVFSTENAVELPEYIRINDYTIKLEENKQPPFGPIYSLEPIELKTLKT